MYHAYSDIGYHIPARETQVVLPDESREVVHEVCVDKLILHRLELRVLECHSLKRYPTSYCGCEPLADTDLQCRCYPVEHIPTAQRRSKKS